MFEPPVARLFAVAIAAVPRWITELGCTWWVLSARRHRIAFARVSLRRAGFRADGPARGAGSAPAQLRAAVRAAPSARSAGARGSGGDLRHSAP